MPDETKFAETFQDAHEDLERRQRKLNRRRNMMMSQNALDEQWRDRAIEANRKIIYRHPEIMQSIIEAVGSRTPY